MRNPKITVSLTLRGTPAEITKVLKAVAKAKVTA